MINRKSFINVLIIMVLFIAIIMTIKTFYNDRKMHAVEIAQDYLSQKYAEEMEPISVRYSWIDPAIYHVTFIPKKTPEIEFKVYVQNDLTIRTNKNKSDACYTSADNYYLQYFNYQMCNHLNKFALNIWGDNSKFNSLIEGGLYSFEIPITLNDQMSLLDMINIVDGYNYYIDVGRNFEQKYIEQEAIKIFKFCEVLKENEYSPDSIFIRYNNERFVIEYHSNLTFESLVNLLM